MAIQKIIGAYDPRELIDQRRQETLSDRDDGSYHVDDPDFFEWWYFDCHTEDGYTAVVAFRNRDYSKMQEPPVPQFTLLVVTPEGDSRTIIKDCPDLVYQAARDNCDVKIGDKVWVKGSGGKYHLHAEEGDAAVDLEFTGTVPGWRPGTGYYYYREDKSKYFGWVIPMPRASVNGTLKIGSHVAEVKNGLGYHDHNYGNTPIAGNIVFWHWGRTHTRDYSIVYCSAQLSDLYGREICPNMMLAKGDKILLSTGQEKRTETGPYMVSPVTKNKYASEYLIEVPYNGSFVTMRYYNNKLLEERDYLPQIERPPHMSKPCYLRLEADLELTVPLAEGTQVVKGKTIHELLVLELKELDKE